MLKDDFFNHSCCYCGRFIGFNSIDLCCSIGCLFNLEEKDPLSEEERRKMFEKTYQEAINKPFKKLGKNIWKIK